MGNMVKGNSQLEAKGICSECEATETYSNWHRDEQGNGWLCKKCYMKFWFRKHSDAVERGYRLRVEKGKSYLYSEKYLAFKDQNKRLTMTSRTGICNFCRAVVGQINAQTEKLCKRAEMHHELYDEKNPSSHILELCKSCHAKVTPKKKRYSRKIIVGGLVVIK